MVFPSIQDVKKLIIFLNVLQFTLQTALWNKYRIATIHSLIKCPVCLGDFVVVNNCAREITRMCPTNAESLHGKNIHPFSFVVAGF
jgi:hypothetical protein